MGFLFPDYNRCGPGVDPEAPRKRGVFRLWEVFSRDYWFIMLAGFLALAGMLPFIAGTAIAYRYLPKTLLASLSQLVYWLAIILFFPVTIIIMLLTSIWLPLLIAFVGLYPAIDDVFQIEKRLHEEE